MALGLAQPVFAALLASSAVSAPFHGGFGVGAGSGPDGTGLFFSLGGYIGYSATSWRDARVILLAHDSPQAILPFAKAQPVVRAKGALAGVNFHVRIVGPMELTASAAAGVGRVSEPTPAAFRVSGGRRTDLAWQYSVGPRFGSERGWVSVEWVWTQFVRYPRPDRLAYLEGRIDGLLISFSGRIF